MTWTLFVEGKFDQEFVKWLLGHLKIDGIEVARIEGGISEMNP